MKVFVTFPCPDPAFFKGGRRERIWSTIMTRLVASLIFCLALSLPAKAEPITILALGDSLFAGYGLDGPQAYPAQLELALKAKGLDVKVLNAGVSGDTAAQGAARLGWALSDDVDAVIVELGANDALRGLAPEQAEAALDEIAATIAAKKLPLLIMGMRAPPNMGPDYGARFEPMFQRVAEKHGAALYAFYLEGVAADAALNQADGIHPNREGVAIIVQKTLPVVEALISKAKE
jgi:acyl-CoA thioesterase I